MWTTRDLQLAAAAGVLVEDFEEDFESEEDVEEDVEAAGVDVDEAADVLFAEERLSVR